MAAAIQIEDVAEAAPAMVLAVRVSEDKGILVQWGDVDLGPPPTRRHCSRGRWSCSTSLSIVLAVQQFWFSSWRDGSHC